MTASAEIGMAGTKVEMILGWRMSSQSLSGWVKQR